MRPLLLYLIIMIIYLLFFIYFFADPILCQGDEISEIKELVDYTVSNKPVSSESHCMKQENLEGNNLEASCNTSTMSVEERLLELKTLLESDRKECQVAHYEFHYWKDSLTRARQRSERSFDLEKILCDNLDRSLNKGKLYVSKIRVTEASLKILDPNYVSKMPKQWFE